MDLKREATTTSTKKRNLKVIFSSMKRINLIIKKIFNGDLQTKRASLGNCIN